MATCPICFEDIQERASPDCCDHIFCLPCLEKWSKLGSFCPVDRKRYKKIVNLELDSYIQIKSRKRKKSREVYDFSAKCEICLDENKPEVLLLCDCCDLAFHIHCLSPKLNTIPAGLWFCATCTSIEKRLRERNGITKEVEVDLGNSKLLFQKARRQRKKEKFAEVKEDPQPTLDELKTDRFIKDKSCNNSVNVCKNVDNEFEGVTFRRYGNGGFLNSNASLVNTNGNFEKMCKSFPCEPQSYKNENIKISETFYSKKCEENLKAKIEIEHINSKNKSAVDLCLKESNEVSLIDDCLSQAASVGYLKFDPIEICESEKYEKNLNAKIEMERISSRSKSADDLCLKESNGISLIEDGLSQAASVGYLKFDSVEIGDNRKRAKNLNAKVEMERISGKSQKADDLCLKESNEVSLIDDCLSQAESVGFLKFDSVEMKECQVRLHQVSPASYGTLPSCSGVSNQPIKGTNFKTLISHLSFDPCSNETDLNNPKIDLAREKISFSVFDKIESTQTKYFGVSAKTFVSVSSDLNISRCFLCKDVIVAASQNYCKICRLKYSVSRATTEEEENCLKYSQAFESSCDIRKRTGNKKSNSQKLSGKNMKKVLERRHRSLIRKLRKISQKKSETC